MSSSSCSALMPSSPTCAYDGLGLELLRTWRHSSAEISYVVIIARLCRARSGRSGRNVRPHQQVESPAFRSVVASAIQETRNVGLAVARASPHRSAGHSNGCCRRTIHGPCSGRVAKAGQRIARDGGGEMQLIKVAAGVWHGADARGIGYRQGTGSARRAWLQPPRGKPLCRGQLQRDSRKPARI